MTAFFGTELKLIVLLSALSLSYGEFLIIKSKTKASYSDKMRYCYVSLVVYLRLFLARVSLCSSERLA